MTVITLDSVASLPTTYGMCDCIVLYQVLVTIKVSFSLPVDRSIDINNVNKHNLHAFQY